MSADHVCRICSSGSGHRHFTCREKLFGLPGEFAYFQCGACGCLQIAQVPPDLDRFYPAHYYSFKPSTGATGGWRQWRHSRRDFTMLTGKGWLGHWIASKRPPTPEVDALRRAGLEPDSHVLDIGCGSGQLLAQLWRAGLRNLAGVDPYLPADVEAAPGVRVRSCPLEQVQDSYDIIMMHHVIEHLPDPCATLSVCRQRLRPGGRLLLRMPCVDCQAWDDYGINWIGCDAPRHLQVHSRRSFDLMAAQTNFKIRDWWCDSGGTQFWTSELMRRGLNLYDSKGVGIKPQDYFSESELAEFDRKAAALNEQGRGDAVGVVAVP